MYDTNTGNIFFKLHFQATLRHIVVAFAETLYPLEFASSFVTWTELEVVVHLVEGRALYHLRPVLKAWIVRVIPGYYFVHLLVD